MDSLLVNVDKYFDQIGFNSEQQDNNNNTSTENDIMLALEAYDKLTDKKRGNCSKKVL